MAQVRQHLNTLLTPRQCRAVVDVDVVDGWGVAACRVSVLLGASQDRL